MKDRLTTLKEFGPTVTVSLFSFFFFLSRNKESEIPTIFVEAQEPKKTKQGIHVYLFCETHLSSY